MKRLINIRLSLLLAVAVILGIVCFHEVLFGNYLLLAICGVAMCTAIIAFACFKSKKWILFAVATAFIILSFFNCWRVFATRQEDVVFDKSGVLTGRVTDIERNGNPQNTLYLENCELEGEVLFGRVKMYVYDGSEYNTGDLISCYAKVTNVYAVKDKVDTFSIRDNVRYEITEAESIVVQSGNLTLDEKVRKYVFDTMSEYMPQNADVAYALLTGDRNALDEAKSGAFSSAGIIHLLVVSGLHVGFIISIFGFALKRTRLPAVAQFLILAIPLGFYAYICNFAPSIMRAIIMAGCVYLARAVYGKYDLLTSLCWATCIILLWQPLFLFDVGFQLSVISVFGISTVFLQIDRALRDRKLNKFVKKLLGGMALSFSCVVATLFVNAYYFGEVSFIGILVNVVAIPMVFVSFVLCLLGLFPSVFHYLATGADYILQALVDIAKGVEKLNLTLPLTAAAIAMVISVVLLFIVGGYVNLKRKGKAVAYSVCAVCLTLCIVSTFIPRNCNNSVKVFFGYDDTVVVATSEQNEIAVVGGFCDEYTSANALEYLKTRRCQSATLYVTKYSEAVAVPMFCEALPVGKVYILDKSLNNDVQKYFDENKIDVVYAIHNMAVGDSISVQPMYDGGLTAVVIKVGKMTVADVVSDGAKAQQFASVRNMDYAIVKDSVKAFSERGIATLSFYQQNFDGNFGANKYGNFTISEKDGTILLNFRRD